MNLRDMEYLVAVADLSHFGKAAEACHVSQPTLSMQLKKLEEYLDVQLFERTNKQVRITEVGKQIANKARVILQQVEYIKEIAAYYENPLAGRLVLGAFPTLASYYLPQMVPKIAGSLPEVTLYLVEEKTPELIQQLQDGKLDAALLALPVEEQGLQHQPLFEDPFYLAVPQQHPLAKRRAVTLSDIMTQDVLLLEEGHCLRAQAMEVCQLAGAKEQQGFRATSLETLRHMVASGVGVTLIPEVAWNSQDGLVYIPFEPPAPKRTIALVWRKSTARTALMEKLADILG